MNKKIISTVISSILIISSLSSNIFAKSFSSKQGVTLNHSWVIKFNKTLKETPFMDANPYLYGVIIKDSNGNQIPLSVSVNSDKKSFTVTPEVNYDANTKYILTVDGVIDSNGNPLKENTTMEFTTGEQENFDISKIHITGSSSLGGSGKESAWVYKNTKETSIAPDAHINLFLSKNIDTSTLSNVTVTDNDGNKSNINVSADGDCIVILPSNDFQDDTKTITVPRNAFKCNTTYTINLSGVKSSDGQDIATKTYSFTTRDYNLNPTISGICNDDYIKYASQYSQQLFNPIDPATGYVKVGLSPAHDDNGTIVYDNQKTWNGTLIPKFQPDGHWNKYSNLQSRNQYDLQIEFQNEYKKIAAKNSDYDSKRLISFNGDVFYDMNDNEFDLYLNHGTELESPTFTTSIYNDPSLDLYSFQRLDNATHPRSAVMGNIQKVQHAQIFIGIPQEQGVQKNLQKLYLYQHLVSIFGYDYADELENYMLQQEYALNSVRDTLQITQIGNIKIWVQDGQFLFKY